MTKKTKGRGKGKVTTTKRKTRIKAKRTTRRTRVAAPAKTGVQTLVSLVLDESASMQVVHCETISSVNEYVDSLKGKGGELLYTLTKFKKFTDPVIEVFNTVPVAQAAKLTEQSYRPDGNTPLYDAVGQTIEGIDAKIAGREKEVGVLVVVVTDGEENASVRYTRERVAEMIRERSGRGWTFVFLGANHDAWAAASSIGIKVSNAVKYDQGNIKNTMTSLGVATLRYASANDSLRAPVSAQCFFSEKEKSDIEVPKGAI